MLNKVRPRWFLDVIMLVTVGDISQRSAAVGWLACQMVGPGCLVLVLV